jgi:hypothetical protein
MILRFFSRLFGSPIGHLDARRAVITRQIDKYRQAVADEHDATDEAITRLTARLGELRAHQTHKF